MAKIAYLIDASNWTYKFISVYSKYKNIKGVNINISTLYGWTRALKSLNYEDIFICLDGYPALSKSWLPSYKGTRQKETDETIYVPKLVLMQFLTKLGERLGKNIKVICSPGQEADQVISSAVHLMRGQVTEDQLFAASFNNTMIDISQDRMMKPFADGAVLTEIPFDYYDICIIGTTDSDMYQLSAIKDVYIDSSMSGTQINYSKETPVAVHNLEPEIIASYKMLVGDTSDNVKGIKIPRGFDIMPAVKCLKDDDRRRRFIKSLSETKNPFKGVMGPVWDLIKQQKLETTIKTNYKVTHLEYYSTPRLLEYPEYQIASTIKKYSLKV